jgi:hypothetical protein
MSTILLFDCYVAVCCSGMLRNDGFGLDNCCIPPQQSLSEVEAPLITSQYRIELLHQINGFLHIDTLIGHVLASKDIPDEALVSFTQQILLTVDCSKDAALQCDIAYMLLQGAVRNVHHNRELLQ